MSGGIESTIRGHLGAAAVVKTVHESTVCEFRVAVSVRRKDAAGEWQNIRTDWVDVACWGRLAADTAALGSGVLVEVRGVLSPGAYLNRDGEAVATSKLTAYAVLTVPRAERETASAGAFDNFVPKFPALAAVAS